MTTIVQRRRSCCWNREKRNRLDLGHTSPAPPYRLGATLPARYLGPEHRQDHLLQRRMCLRAYASYPFSWISANQTPGKLQAKVHKGSLGDQGQVQVWRLWGVD